MENSLDFIEFIKSLNKQAYRLPLYLGRGRDNSDIVVDFPSAGSILMLGSAGTGKTMFAHSTICSLISSFSPDYLDFLLIDLKEKEFKSYENLSSIIEEPIYSSSEAIRALNAMSITPGYKYQIVLIDTFSELVFNYGTILPRIIKNLTSRRNTFIIMWDSRPYEEIFSPEIKECFSSKIIFNLQDKRHAKVIIDETTDEIPEEKGEAMIFCKESSSPIFARCPYMSESDILRVVSALR